MKHGPDDQNPAHRNLLMRHPSRLLIAAAILVLAAPLSGCFFSREIANTRRDIERSHPDLRLERQIVLNLGPFSLRTLRWLGGMVPDDEVDMATDYMRDVSRVKVGVYRSRRPAAVSDFDVAGIRFDDGWTTAVKSWDADSRVWVLYREGDHTVRDLYIVVFENDDLVVARVRGNLSRLLARIVEDHANLDRMFGDEAE